MTDEELRARPRWEPSAKHPRMPLADRAKIFMPFSSLRGFDDELSEARVLMQPKVFLSEEQRAEIDETLHTLARRLAAGERPEVTAEVFREERPGWGFAETVRGQARRVDAAGAALELAAERIPFVMMTALRVDGTDTPETHREGGGTDE